MCFEGCHVPLYLVQYLVHVFGFSQRLDFHPGDCLVAIYGRFPEGTDVSNGCSPRPYR